MADVRFDGVKKQFGAVTVIEKLDLTIEDQEFMVLVGPSGCGKSTALRMIAGLEEVSAGTVSIGGRVVNDVPPKDRDIAMVFQSYALYPHMSVRENLEFGLRMRKMPQTEIAKLVDDAAEILGLTPLLDRRPRQLSGGQRQRVAVGRAIVRKPSVFLFDEPLSNLDAKLRVQMRAEIAKLQQRLKTTTVYVTHDQVEAMTMGRRIAIMSDGKLQQVGTPLEVYEKPQSLFVATFIGTPPMNLFQARITDGGSTLAAGTFQIPVPDKARASVGTTEGRKVTVGIRAENVVGTGMQVRGRPVRVKVSVEIVEPLGHEVIAHARTGEDLLVAKLEPHLAPSMGDETEFILDADAVHVFDAETGARLGA